MELTEEIDAAIMRYGSACHMQGMTCKVGGKQWEEWTEERKKAAQALKALIAYTPQAPNENP